MTFHNSHARDLVNPDGRDTLVPLNFQLQMVYTVYMYSCMEFGQPERQERESLARPSRSTVNHVAGDTSGTICVDSPTYIHIHTSAAELTL